jgi:hypothetical protein
VDGWEEGDGWAGGGGIHIIVSESGDVSQDGKHRGGGSTGTCPWWRTPPASRKTSWRWRRWGPGLQGQRKLGEGDQHISAALTVQARCREGKCRAGGAEVEVQRDGEVETAVESVAGEVRPYLSKFANRICAGAGGRVCRPRVPRATSPGEQTCGGAVQCSAVQCSACLVVPRQGRC